MNIAYKLSFLERFLQISLLKMLKIKYFIIRFYISLTCQYVFFSQLQLFEFENNNKTMSFRWTSIPSSAPSSIAFAQSSSRAPWKSLRIFPPLALFIDKSPPEQTSLKYHVSLGILVPRYLDERENHNKPHKMPSRGPRIFPGLSQYEWNNPLSQNC